MPKLNNSLLQQDNICLVVSCLIFPFSLKASIFCFTCFLLARILFYDFIQSEFKLDKLACFIKIALSIATAVSVIYFYIESRSHFYPVSYYDYLFVLITAMVVKLFPLSKSHVQQVCLAISLSPITVFINHVNDISFESRNSWGFDNSNGLGLYCSVCIPIIICLASHVFIRDFKIKYASKILLISLVLSLIICALMLVSSGSRSSLYTSILMLLFIAISNFNSRQGYIFHHLLKITKSNYVFYYYAIIFAFFYFLYKFIITKFAFIKRFINLTNSTNLYRTHVYKCYFSLGIDKPWWGWGMDKTSTLCEQKLKARYGGVNHAHNFVLQLFADHGVIVTILCLICIAHFIFLPTAKFIINYDFAVDSILCLGVYLSSLSILVISLFQSSFYHYPLFPLWLGLFWGIQLNFNKSRLSNN